MIFTLIAPRKPTTVMERRPSENPSAYLPTSLEDCTTTFTWGESLKMAPLKRSWSLVYPEILASPREAQLRLAPCRSVLSREVPRKSALSKEVPYKVAPSRLTPRRSAPGRSAQLRSASHSLAAPRLAPCRSAQHR